MTFSHTGMQQKFFLGGGGGGGGTDGVPMRIAIEEPRNLNKAIIEFKF